MKLIPPQIRYLANTISISSVTALIQLSLIIMTTDMGDVQIHRYAELSIVAMVELSLIMIPMIMIVMIHWYLI